MKWLLALLALLGIAGFASTRSGDSGGSGDGAAPPETPPPVTPPPPVIPPDYGAAEEQFKSYIRDLMIYYGSQGVQIPCSYEANLAGMAGTIPVEVLIQWYKEVRGC